jgi:hypothetical protein
MNGSKLTTEVRSSATDGCCTGGRARDGGEGGYELWRRSYTKASRLILKCPRKSHLISVGAVGFKRRQSLRAALSTWSKSLPLVQIFRQLDKGPHGKNMGLSG